MKLAQFFAAHHSRRSGRVSWRRVLTVVSVAVLASGGVASVPASAAAPVYGSLAAAFNNVGVAAAGSTGANLDGAGSGFTAAGLSQAGIASGGTLTEAGLKFSWPTTIGKPDNVVASGQSFKFAGAGATLGFLVTGTTASASVGGTGTITFANGSTQSYSLSSADWLSPTPAAGSLVALQPYSRLAGGGTASASQAQVYYVGVPLRSSTAISQVTLPNAGTNAANALHVFAVAAGTQTTNSWTGSWEVGMQPPNGGFSGGGSSNFTLRQIMRLSTGGTAVRITLSNVFGSGPLTVDHTTVATSLGGASIDPSTLRDVTFGGQRSVTIPVGQQIASDPIADTVGVRENLAVSTYDSGPVPSLDQHFQGEPVYVGGGDVTSSASAGLAYYGSNERFIVSDIDVLGPSTRTLIFFGDSITDGYGSTVNARMSYPDQFNALQPAYSMMGVNNEGISATELINGIVPNGLSRFNRDVASRPGIKTLISLIGTNDIHVSQLSAPALEAGYQTLVNDAHAAGIQVLQGTIIPCTPGGAPNQEATRLAINQFIRTSGLFDGFIDYDAVMRDPANPSYIYGPYDYDGVHPNDAGYGVMAAAAAKVLTPGSSLIDNTSALTVGPVSAGATTTAQLRLSNVGNAPVSVASVGGLPSTYSVSGISAGNVIAAGQTRTVTVSYSPTDGAAATSTLTITTSTGARLAVTVSRAVNLALNSAATQSSTAFGGSASRAVDGNTDGNYLDNSVTHTGADPNSWWQVDLGRSSTINSVTVWNRTDCCSDRLADYWIFVSNQPFDTTQSPTALASTSGLTAVHQTSTPAPSTTVSIPPGSTGRYVMIMQNTPNQYLSLAEVQVIGASGP